MKRSEAPDERSTDSLFQQYYDERIQLYPLEATLNGINTYNDQLPNDISEAYRTKLRAFYQKYLDTLNTYDRTKLDHNDQMSYDVLQWELNINLEQLSFHDNLMPINQFWSLPLTMGQLGSGSGNQPFKTAEDYTNFLKRLDGFAVWCDTAIVNMKRGLSLGITPPKILMERVLPQLKSVISQDVTKSIFYMPVLNMDSSISETERDQ
ncbi:MAG: DUF885 family protein, partial [Chitinophagales bacterium]|nr:DUF885 family protein [Chitinophagales bacterium]